MFTWEFTVVHSLVGVVQCYKLFIWRRCYNLKLTTTEDPWMYHLCHKLSCLSIHICVCACMFVCARVCLFVYVYVCVCGSELVWCSTHEKSHTKLAFLAKNMFLMPTALSKAFKEKKSSSIQTHLEKYRVFSPLGTVAHKVCLWDGFDSIKFY